ncbi:MAG: hypothetical protein EA388_07230 [Nitriliruptor sp.]|nr:MAG: hypothetical protein EA388_07230 [Nitriliruptor sp.]
MTVRVQSHDRVLTVTIDRPEVRNAVDRPTAEALDEAFLAFEQDPRTDVAVLGGADGTFCAGADLHTLSDPDRANRQEAGHAGPMGPTRRSIGEPVIAAIEGHAVAGGLATEGVARFRAGDGRGGTALRPEDQPTDVG